MIRIIGTGSAVPAKRVTNDDLGQIVDTSDEWIRSRTGIESRCIAVDETTTGLATDAARRALEDAGIAAGELDLIIAATVTPDRLLPNLSCEVQRELGAENAVAFDLNAACAGFLFSLDTACMYLQAGRYRTALVLGAETLSKLIDWSDRSTCVLFGDGAGAAVITTTNEDTETAPAELKTMCTDERSGHTGEERTTEKEGSTETKKFKEAGGILSIRMGSDGSRGMVLACDNRPVSNPYVKRDHALSYVSMNGQEVYKFAVRTVPTVIAQAVEDAGLTPDEIDLYLLHQANYRIIESVAKRLRQPMEKFPVNLRDHGNISAASVPILLDNVKKHGMIEKGSRLVLAGFGAGLTWGATVLEW